MSAGMCFNEMSREFVVKGAVIVWRSAWGRSLARPCMRIAPDACKTLNHRLAGQVRWPKIALVQIAISFRRVSLTVMAVIGVDRGKSWPCGVSIYTTGGNNDLARS